MQLFMFMPATRPLEWSMRSVDGSEVCTCVDDDECNCFTFQKALDHAYDELECDDEYGALLEDVSISGVRRPVMLSFGDTEWYCPDGVDAYLGGNKGNTLWYADGHHRLAAAIECGQEVPVVWAWSWPEVSASHKQKAYGNDEGSAT